MLLSDIVTDQYLFQVNNLAGGKLNVTLSD